MSDALDLSRLRRMAEKAKQPCDNSYESTRCPRCRFMNLMGTPEAVIALIDRVIALEAKCEQLEAAQP